MKKTQTYKLKKKTYRKCGRVANKRESMREIEIKSGRVKQTIKKIRKKSDT